MGGTKEVDDLELAPRRATRELLLRQFAATHPPTLTSGAVTGAAVSGDEAIPSSARDALVRAQADGMDGNRVGFSVIADIVGWRPTRKGGMRLETERLGNGSGVVVHAYGLGGRGYELSWGVAEEVLHHVGETTSLG